MLATIQPRAAIKLIVTNLNDLYLNLKNLRVHVLAKISKAGGTSINTNTAARINLTIHSMVHTIALEMNGRNVADTSQLYRYR